MLPLRMLFLAGAACALRLPSTPGLVPLQHAAIISRRAPSPIAQDEDTAGKGFGAVKQDNSDATLLRQERGKKALEAMRLEAGAPPRKAPSSEPEPYIPTDQEKNTVAYGLAGFFILSGVVLLFIGGPVWESKGANEDGSAPVESAGLFGFAPASPAEPAAAADSAEPTAAAVPPPALEPAAPAEAAPPPPEEAAAPQS